MFATVMLALQATGNEGARILLLLCVLVAVLLVLAGGGIAVATLYFQRKALTAEGDDLLRE